MSLTKTDRQPIWNDDAGQYVCSYDKNGVTRKIWFEEDKSIEEKLKVVVDNRCRNCGMEARTRESFCVECN